MRTIPGVLKLFPVALFSLIVFINTGCQKTAIQYGQQYIDNGITSIILVDSISPVVTTVYKDSVFTSQSAILLVGSYTDPYLGKTSSDSYFQLVPPVLKDVLNNAQYDSLVLLTKCSGSYYGDTTLPVTFSVKQLTQEIKLGDGQISFANISTFPLNPTPLGQKTIVLRPLTGDSANIRLSDTKGQELFNLIRNKADVLKDNAVFTDYFKGLNISATSNGNVYGLKDSVVMRVYYHQTDLSLQNNYFDFTFYNPSLQFNHITADRTGTPLTTLSPTNTELLSTASNNIGYLQPATGIYLKISFPNIRSILQRTDFIKIVRAELVVKPIINSFNGNYPLPPVLMGDQTDGLNEPGASIVSVSSGSAITATGNLFQDAIYGVGTQYTYDVTTYLQQELGITITNKDGLLLLPATGTRSSTMNRLVIGDALNLKNKLQLNVYYISVNK